MKRPLVYYAMSVFAGCFSVLLLFEDVFLGAVVAASFFAILFFTVDKDFFIICNAFAVVGIFSFILYFNLKVPQNACLRVIDKKGYCYIVSYKGRKVNLSSISKLEIGEKIKAQGDFENVKNYTSGIIGTYKVKNYEVLSKDFIYYMYDLKRKIYDRLAKNIGQERSALVMSLCYGDTTYLSKTQKGQFQQLGVFHAISVSGFHMAIIYKLLESIAGLKLAVFFSALYVLFTGFQAATLRAFIMIFIFKLSKIVFKNYDSISSLSLSALIILVVKPYYVADIGFMLSVMATLGIILFYKSFLRLFIKLPQKLNESLSVTMSSQIFSVPYIAFTIKNFSSGFILGNIFLLPIYSLIVVLGNIAIFVYNTDILFKPLCVVINIVMTALDGANHILLEYCPNVSFLTYLDGVALSIMFVSYMLFKSGYKKCRYLPFFMIAAMLIQNYSFLPQIYSFKFKEGQSVVVKYKDKNIMLCSDSGENVKDFINLKDHIKVDKVITNIEAGNKIKVDDEFYLKILPHSLNNIQFEIDKGNSRYYFNDNKPGKIKNEDEYVIYDYEEDYNLYVIIFGRIFAFN